MNKDSSQFNLSGKVCVIVGGAGLIGAEFARECAKEGGHVVIADIDTVKGQALADEINGTFFECDSTNEASVIALAENVEKKFKKVDALVNATYPKTDTWGTRYEDLSYEDFLTHVGMQTGTHFLTARTFGKLMQKQKSGSVVFIGSIYGVHPPRFEIYEGSDIKPPAVEYAVAKGGLLMLTRYLAKYYGPSGVRVNMISPGGVWNKQDKAFEEKYNRHAVLGNRMAGADDIAPTLAYLFSDASKFVTGQNIVIDGGWTL